MTIEDSATDKLTIRGVEIPVTRAVMRHEELRFYPENPRVYSLLGANADEPTQDEIEKCLIVMDHVRQLKQSIMANGGVIDPLIVRKGKNIVLEGNSRLAAYRLLSRGNPIKWAEVKCLLLPEDISEDCVFALLGEYHIIGRKDWAPFEQAGYLWRRNKRHNIPPEQMEKEMGLSVKMIKGLIEVYSFMVERNEVDPQRWSHYYEYLKCRKIASVRAICPDLDDVVVKQIRTGQIPKAADVRDKLSRVCSAEKGKAVRHFVSGERSLDECYEEAIAGGADNVFYQRLHKFREVISTPDAKRDLRGMPSQVREKCRFELNKIKKKVTELCDALSQDA